MRDRPQGWPVPPAAQPALAPLAAAPGCRRRRLRRRCSRRWLTTATRCSGCAWPALCGLAAVGGTSVAAVRAAARWPTVRPGRRGGVAAPARGAPSRGCARRAPRSSRPAAAAWAVSVVLTCSGAFAGRRAAAAGDAGVRLEIGARRDPGARPPLRLPLGGKGAHELRRRPHAAALGGARRQPRAVATPPPAARGAALPPRARRARPSNRSPPAPRAPAAPPAAQRAVLHARAARARDVRRRARRHAARRRGRGRAAALALQTADDAGAACGCRAACGEVGIRQLIFFSTASHTHQFYLNAKTRCM